MTDKPVSDLRNKTQNFSKLVHKKLLEAETRKASGEKPESFRLVMKRLKNKLNKNLILNHITIA
jgi:hypothetical protein